MSELIGSAELDVGTDLAPLDAGIADAKAKAVKGVAELQAIFDRLHIGVNQRAGLLSSALDQKLSQPFANLGDGAQAMASQWNAALDSVRASITHTAEVTVAASEVEVAAIDKVTAAYLEQAAAARVAGDAAVGRGAAADVLAGSRGGEGPVGAAFATREQRGGGEGLTAAELAALASMGVEGVRGKGHAGSRVDPLVVVLEAGRYTPLGGMSAAVGYQGLSGAATTTVAQGGSQGGATNVLSSSRTPGEPPVVVPGASEDRSRGVQDAALAAGLAKLTQAMERPLAAPAGPATVHREGQLPLLVFPGEEEAAQRDLLLAKGGGGKSKAAQQAVPVVVAGTEPSAARTTGDAVAAAVADQAAKGRSGSELYPGQFASSALADYYAAKGFTAATAPDGRIRLYGVGGAAGTRNFGASPLATATGTAAGGGGGGGGVPPWLMPLLWGRSGGGGGGGRLGGLLTAGGALAGFGSLGSFAGFGPEHLLLTAGGIAGSGVAALGGGALLGAGAAGKVGVGMGSDALVMASTIADTKQLYAAYEKLNRAQQVYGKDSEQAKEASLELNKVLDELSNTAGVKAEAGVAKAAIALNEYWDKATSGARVQASKILMQVLELGRAYIPLVAKAAEQNFSATSTGLKPLFEWLKGPEGMGIFLQLEREFKDEIPTAMKALDMGVQFFAKTIAYTAPLTGAFLTKLDDFFTKWNSPGEFAVWEREMQKLIADFHVWGHFLKALGGALVDLFDKDAHTGQGIIEVLTVMLEKIRAWENSTSGAASIRNIFTLHKEEVIELLKALVPLVSSFSHIYVTVAPPLVKAVTEIARGFDWLLETIEKGGKMGEWLIGLTLIAGKLKILNPLLTEASAAFKGAAGAQGESAAAASAQARAEALAAGATEEDAGAAAQAAAANAGLAGAQGAGAAEGGGAAGLIAGAGEGGLSATLLKGGVAGAAGLLGGSLLAGATGAKGTLATSISGAGAGAGLGFVGGGAISGAVLGTEITPVVGTAIGAVLGAATPYAVKFLEDVFATHAPDYGKKLAEGIVAPMSALGVGEASQKGIASALDAAHRASKPTGLSDDQAAGISTALNAVPLVGPSLASLSQGLLRGSGPNRAAQARDEQTAGQRVAEAFVQGFEEVRFPTKSVLLGQMVETLGKLPPQVRMAAAKAMIAYATELESKGDLPKGAVTEVIHGLEGQFPHLATYLKAQGESMSSQFARALELKDAQGALANSLDEISQLFGTSNADTVTNAEHTMSQLVFVIAHSKGPLKKAAEEAYGELKAATRRQLELTKNQSGNLVEEMNQRVMAGMETLAQGIRSINKQLEGEFAALGVPKEITTTLVTGKGSNPLKSNPFGHAQGGLLQIGRPGEAGHDSVPLNVGGLPIMVAPGEQVAVFNRHQLPVVNAALAGVGGLPGLFSQVNTPNYMASGGIVAPHVGGFGAIPELVRGALKDVANAANEKLGQERTAAGAAARGGAGGAPSSSGLPAAAAAALRRIASEKGWSVSDWLGVIALESGGNPAARNPSGAYGIGQALGSTQAEFPKMVSSNPVEQVEGMAEYIASRYGTPTAALAHEHADHWYGLGGLVGFDRGGLLGAPLAVGLGFARGGSVPKRAKALPKGQSWRVHPFGKIPPVKTSWWGEGYLDELNSLMGSGGALAGLTEQYGLEETADELALTKAPHAGAFVVQPNALEKAAGVTLPYEDAGNVQLRSTQLGGLSHTEYGVLNDLTEAWNLSSKVLSAAHDGVQERNKAIAELKARIAANLKRIKECREAIKRQEDQLKKLPTGKHATAASRAQAAKLHKEIADEHSQIKSLEDENARLGGDRGEIGTGGSIGTLVAQRTELHETKTATEGYVQEIGGASGKGGKRAETQDAIAKLAQQMVELGETPLREKEALLEGGSGPESALELSEREKTQTEEKNKNLKEEVRLQADALSVFRGPGDIGVGAANAFAAATRGGLFTGFGPLPFAGHFDTGGIVPGPIGQAAVAVVHGGEEVRTPAQQEPSLHFEQHNHMLHPSDPSVLTTIGKASVKGINLQGLRRSKRWKPGI